MEQINLANQGKKRNLFGGGENLGKEMPAAEVGVMDIKSSQGMGISNF